MIDTVEEFWSAEVLDKLHAAPRVDPKAFADSKAIAFTKNMEGAGLSLDEPALSPALVAAE